MAVFVALAVALLGVEVVVAQNGPHLANEDGFPTQQNGLVNPGAPGKPVKVAWLGDSTISGVGASSPEMAIPQQVARGLGEPVDLTVVDRSGASRVVSEPGRPVELTVLARSGARITDVVNDQLPKLLALPPDDQPDVVVVGVGGNDAIHLTSNNTFRSKYLGLLDGLPKGADRILLGVPDLGSTPRFPEPLRWVIGVRGGTLDAVVENMRLHDADYVNIADFTGPYFGADPDRYHAADRFHPNDEGYGLWSRTILPVLQWRLYKRDHPDLPEPLQPREAKGTVKDSSA